MEKEEKTYLHWNCNCRLLKIQKIYILTGKTNQKEEISWVKNQLYNNRVYTEKFSCKMMPFIAASKIPSLRNEFKERMSDVIPSWRKLYQKPLKVTKGDKRGR